MMQSKIFFFCYIQTVRNDFGQILLLQSVIATISIVSRLQQSDYRISKLRLSTVFKKQFNKLFSIRCFFDSSHVAESIEEFDYGLELKILEIKHSIIIIKQGGQREFELRNTLAESVLILHKVYFLKIINYTDQKPPISY